MVTESRYVDCHTVCLEQGNIVCGRASHEIKYSLSSESKPQM